MERTALSSEQRTQEAGYFFPYHYLDLKVDEYRYIYHTEYLHVLKAVKELLKPFEGKLILDFGCGDGRFEYEMRNESSRVIGVDYSERAISFAKAFNPKAEFYTQDILNLKLSHMFDHIVMIETLEHVYPSEIPALLEKLAEMLKQEGSLIITVPTNRVPLSDKHYQHFTEESLTKAIESHFTVKKCIGYSRITISRKLHSLLKIIGTYIFPFRKHVRLVYRYFELLNDYWASHYGVGNPADCAGIIAICNKKRFQMKSRNEPSESIYTK
jgi:2-polyprenyl-3-methyl-5-hydroxy-6-metoxy-1,4-benzoquinol methylase